MLENEFCEFWIGLPQIYKCYLPARWCHLYTCHNSRKIGSKKVSYSAVKTCLPLSQSTQGVKSLNCHTTVCAGPNMIRIVGEYTWSRNNQSKESHRDIIVTMGRSIYCKQRFIYFVGTSATRPYSILQRHLEAKVEKVENLTPFFSRRNSLGATFLMSNSKYPVSP